jgi:hypothetical protein
MGPQILVRGRNALSSGAAALLALLIMALWMGGLQEFPRIVSGGMNLLLLISFGALVLGAFLSARRIRWSVLVGALSGLAAGTAIVLYGMSHI